ncbi:hypothetical protein J007_01261 [Cryptococcus neoformans]|nr:hypothetical protein J007_01261 [Cryptococcus neoformans var. grubii]OXC63610.1 hypothetical protein C358_01319 [Cryptococcus neoformans var. grubii MW-RSA852]
MSMCLLVTNPQQEEHMLLIIHSLP